MYWLVKNWKIETFYKNLPKSNQQISWLDKLSDIKLRELWYYKVIWTSLPLKDYETYWATTYTIWTEYIEEVKEIITTPLEDYKASKIAEQSKRTNTTILASYSYEEQLNTNRELWKLQDQFNQSQTVDITRLTELRSIDTWIEWERAKYRTRRDEINLCNTQEEVYNLIQQYNGIDNTTDSWLTS